EIGHFARVGGVGDALRQRRDVCGVDVEILLSLLAVDHHELIGRRSADRRIMFTVWAEDYPLDREAGSQRCFSWLAVHEQEGALCALAILAEMRERENQPVADGRDVDG